MVASIAISRREMIAASAAAAAVVAAGCSGAVSRTAIARLADLTPWRPLFFSFPGDFPAILLDVGRSIGGVGPNRSIVAYSAVCTHMGCSVQLDASLKIEGHSTPNLVCPCHKSAFDPASLGAAIAGPATYGLPIVELEVSGRTIYAVGVRAGRPLFGTPLPDEGA